MRIILARLGAMTVLGLALGGCTGSGGGSLPIGGGSGGGQGAPKTNVPTINGTAATAQLTTIAIPGIPSTPAFKYDLESVDSTKRRIFLADRTNKTVDVFNPDTLTLTTQLTGFCGQLSANEVSGPNAPVPVPGTDVLYVSDCNTQIKVVNVSTNTLIKNIVVTPGDPNRVDEGSYDADDKLAIFNIDNDAVPSTVFIDANPASPTYNTIVARVLLPNATAGTGYVFYDPGTKNVFIELPASTANPNGELDGVPIAAVKPGGLYAGAAGVNFNPATAGVVYPTPNCQGAGMALGPNDQAIIGCDPPAGYPEVSLIMDLTNGAIVQTITRVGGSDQVWFNPTNKRYYLAARNMTANGIANGAGAKTPVLGVVDAVTLQWIENVPTGSGSHAVAVDPVTNRVFVPIPTGNGVFANPQ